MTWTVSKPTTFTPKKSEVIRGKTGLLLRPTERVNNKASDFTTRPPSSASSNPVHPVQSRINDRRTVPSRLMLSEAMAQELDSVVSDKSSKESLADGQAAKDETLKKKAKRSFRNVFSRHDLWITPKPVREQDHKRSSVVGSALAQRIRKSTNFSKVSLTRPPTAKTEPKGDPEFPPNNVEATDLTHDRQATLSTIKCIFETTPVETPPGLQCDTATVIYNILDRVALMKENSRDCLLGLEIAEVRNTPFQASPKTRTLLTVATNRLSSMPLSAPRKPNSALSLPESTLATQS